LNFDILRDLTKLLAIFTIDTNNTHACLCLHKTEKFCITRGEEVVRCDRNLEKFIISVNLLHHADRFFLRNFGKFPSDYTAKHTLR
jgi:hypothetical protein